MTRVRVGRLFDKNGGATMAATMVTMMMMTRSTVIATRCTSVACHAYELILGFTLRNLSAETALSIQQSDQIVTDHTVYQSLVPHLVGSHPTTVTFR
jgi:hypothetical protein